MYSKNIVTYFSVFLYVLDIKSLDKVSAKNLDFSYSNSRTIRRFLYPDHSWSRLFWIMHEACIFFTLQCAYHIFTLLAVCVAVSICHQSEILPSKWEILDRDNNTLKSTLWSSVNSSLRRHYSFTEQNL